MDNLKKDEEADNDDDDDLSPDLAKKIKAAQQQSTATKNQKSTSNSAPSQSSIPVPTKPPKPRAEILNPSDPQLILPSSESGGVTPDASVATPTTSETQASGWRHGSKRILRSVVNVCQNLNQLLLKVVAKMFPWNRRAKRRLKVGGANEDAD